MTMFKMCWKSRVVLQIYLDVNLCASCSTSYKYQMSTKPSFYTWTIIWIFQKDHTKRSGSFCTLFFTFYQLGRQDMFFRKGIFECLKMGNIVWNAKMFINIYKKEMWKLLWNSLCVINWRLMNGGWQFQDVEFTIFQCWVDNNLANWWNGWTWKKLTK